MKKLFILLVGLFGLLGLANAASSQETFVQNYIEKAMSQYTTNQKIIRLSIANGKLIKIIPTIPSEDPKKSILTLIHTVVENMLAMNPNAAAIILNEELVDTNEKVVDIGFSQEQKALFEAVNVVRQQNGLEKLTVNSTLQTLAQGHLDEMVDNDYFSHTNLAGENSSTRITNSGYKIAFSGETLANNASNADVVIDGWMNSPVHKEILLHPNAQEVGIGHAKKPGNNGIRLALFAAPL